MDVGPSSISASVRMSAKSWARSQGRRRATLLQTDDVSVFQRGQGQCQAALFQGGGQRAVIGASRPRDRGVEAQRQCYFVPDGGTVIRDRQQKAFRRLEQ